MLVESADNAHLWSHVSTQAVQGQGRQWQSESITKHAAHIRTCPDPATKKSLLACIQCAEVLVTCLASLVHQVQTLRHAGRGRRTTLPSEMGCHCECMQACKRCLPAHNVLLTTHALHVATGCLQRPTAGPYRALQVCSAGVYLNRWASRSHVGSDQHKRREGGSTTEAWRWHVAAATPSQYASACMLLALMQRGLSEGLVSP